MVQMSELKTEKGSRKVEMLIRTQWLAFVLSIAFFAIKGFVTDGAPGLTSEMFLYALVGVGVNFGVFAVANVGEHKHATK